MNFAPYRGCVGKEKAFKQSLIHNKPAIFNPQQTSNL